MFYLLLQTTLACNIKQFGSLQSFPFVFYHIYNEKQLMGVIIGKKEHNITPTISNVKLKSPRRIKN